MTTKGPFTHKRVHKRTAAYVSEALAQLNLPQRLPSGVLDFESGAVATLSDLAQLSRMYEECSLPFRRSPEVC